MSPTSPGSEDGTVEPIKAPLSPPLGLRSETYVHISAGRDTGDIMIVFISILGNSSFSFAGLEVLTSLKGKEKAFPRPPS